MIYQKLLLINWNIHNSQILLALIFNDHDQNYGSTLGNTKGKDKDSRTMTFSMA